MAEILMIRHAQSYANKRDAAFGNMKSPLTPKGREQVVELREKLPARHGITPAKYGKPVVASEYLRTQQTAELTGFPVIHVNPVINESEIPLELRGGRDIINKHASEHWIPEEVKPLVEEFIDNVRSSHFEYQIYFSHGMFIAGLLTHLQGEDPENFDHPFDPERGFIPLQASITPVTIV